MRASPPPPRPSAPTSTGILRRQYASGQVLIIFALFSVVLIGALALSIDAGYLMSERRQSQSAADSGAMAAAIALVGNKPWSEAKAPANRMRPRTPAQAAWWR